MRLIRALLPLLAAADAAHAVTGWLHRAAYNKWHETELERWLSDHNIPYPTPGDRKDLQDRVSAHWNDYAVAPYNNWDAGQLAAHLKSKGIEAKDNIAASAGEHKNWLLEQIKSVWPETEAKALHGYADVKSWILDSWTNSQLRSLCQHHGIAVPKSSGRDELLNLARQNLEAIAKKSHQTFGYPGNWLYDTWAESDLKAWLDTYGFDVPQPSTRDQLVATVRRNSHLAYLQMQAESSRLQDGVKGAYASVTDALLDAWGNSELMNFCNKNGISVPQGSRVEEIRALIRRQRAVVLGDTVAGRFGAATTKAGNEYAKATDAFFDAASATYASSIDTWSDSRLKAFLDARGIPVPQASTIDELRALVRKNAHKAASGWTAWTWDDPLYNFFRDTAQSCYRFAVKAGGNGYATASEYFAGAKNFGVAHDFRNLFGWFRGRYETGADVAKEKVIAAHKKASGEL